MIRRFTSTKKVSPQDGLLQGERSVDDLVLSIKKLIRHHGYDRAKVTSERLKRYLPRERGLAWAGESAIRQDHASARLDASMLDYLLENVRVELHMAHERQTG